VWLVLAAWDPSSPFALLVVVGLDECSKRIDALCREVCVELEPVLSVPERGRVEPAHSFSAPFTNGYKEGVQMASTYGERII